MDSLIVEQQEAWARIHPNWRHQRPRWRKILEPSSPVISGFEQHEVVFAKDQPPYKPLPMLTTRKDNVMRVASRWTPSPSEREAIAEGADIFFMSLKKADEPLQPVLLSVDSCETDRARVLAYLSL